MTLEEARTLKPGDEVRCIAKTDNYYTKGKIYVITKFHREYEMWRFGIKANNNGVECGWGIENFELTGIAQNNSDVPITEEVPECRCSFKGLGHDLDCEYVKAKNAI